LTLLAPVLPDTLKSEALVAARAIQHEVYQVQVLAALAPTLPDALKAEVLTEALAKVYTLTPLKKGQSAELLFGQFGVLSIKSNGYL
jgi:hypothetical protein